MKSHVALGAASVLVSLVAAGNAAHAQYVSGSVSVGGGFAPPPQQTYVVQQQPTYVVQQPTYVQQPGYVVQQPGYAVRPQGAPIRGPGVRYGGSLQLGGSLYSVSNGFAPGVTAGVNARLGWQLDDTLGIYAEGAYQIGTVSFSGTGGGSSTSDGYLGTWSLGAMAQVNFGPVFLAAGASLVELNLYGLTTSPWPEHSTYGVQFPARVGVDLITVAGPVHTRAISLALEARPTASWFGFSIPITANLGYEWY